MTPIDAIRLPSIPVPGLIHVRDLIAFDGPLLSLFRNASGDNYLYYWCDRDETVNRWMILRVSEASVLRLINHFVPLDYVIPKGCRDHFVYFVDIGANDAVLASYLLMVEDIPEDYRPVDGTYLPPQREDEDDHTYSFLIEGEWSAEAIGNFPKTFSQVYSVLYGLNVLQVPDVPSHPWRGGYSALHFFNHARSIIPSEDRPIVDAIQKSSPGFIRFSLDVRTARQVVQCVNDYKSKRSLVDYRDSFIERYIRRHRLNDIRDPESDEWDPHEEKLAIYSRSLLKEFGAIEFGILSRVTPRVFEGVKIAQSFLRRIRELERFESDGLVKFPRIPRTAN